MTKAGDSAVPVTVSIPTIVSTNTRWDRFGPLYNQFRPERGECRRILAGASLVSVQNAWRVVTILDDGLPPYDRCERLINPSRTVGVRETPQYGVCILKGITSAYLTSTQRTRAITHTQERISQRAPPLLTSLSYAAIVPATLLIVSALPTSPILVVSALWLSGGIAVVLVVRSSDRNCQRSRSNHASNASSDTSAGRSASASDINTT